MANRYPVTAAEMDGIPGMGEKKKAEFADIFAETIADYLKTNSRQSFA
jgi:ATP-dependent DNA helicase RecQ